MSRSSLTRVVALLALATSVWAAPAKADAPARSRRVVLLETPTALERALRTALMPWGMRVARSQARSTPRTPKSPEEARNLARRLKADALVWLARSSKRHELWLYDGSNGTLTTRSVPAPPFDETRAAALALSVKTELRKGTLADAPALAVSDVAAKTVPAAGKDTPAERAALAAPESEIAPPLASDARDATEPAEPTLAEPAPPEARAASPESDAPYAHPTWTPSDAPHWKLVLHAAARLGATTLGGTEGRYAVEGRWAPWADPDALMTIWLSARFDMGLPRTIESAAFAGEYSELGGGLGAGASLRVSRWVELGMQVGAALRAATISGSLSDAAPAEQARRGLDVHLRPELELSLGALGVLVQPGLGAAIIRQRYQADGVEVLETSPIWWQLGAGVRVALD